MWAHLKLIQKIDLNAFINRTPKIDKKNYHFIRIGVLNSYSPRKVKMQQNMYGVMIVTPPWLNRLRIKQQQFRQCMEQLKWNSILKEEKDDKEDSMTKDDDDSDNDDSNDDDSKDVNKEKENPSPLIVMPVKDINNTKTNMARSYPHLSKVLGGEDGFFDPTDPLVQKLMHSLLRELNGVLSTTYEFNTTIC